MRPLTHDEVRLHVEADSATLYALVSDVTRIPEWSPAVVECRWLDGATVPAVGARFRARNRLRWFTWSTKPVVETATPGAEFAIVRTEPGGGSIRWSHRFEPTACGTLVVHSYEVLQPVPLGLHRVLRLVFGVRDLEADLRANMVTSTGRLADIATGALAPPAR